MMDTEGKILIVGLSTLVVVVVALPILFHNAYMKPSGVTGYVIGYQTGYDMFGLQRTVVTISYGVVTIGTDGEINAHTCEREYAGENMFELGKLYRIRSEGNFWWMYTKITEAVILPIAGAQ